jgi:SAM-dependent methyltransferase
VSSAITPEALRADYERIWSTTEMRESPEYYERCLALASPRAGERLLDVACGGGSLLAVAERAGLVTHGIDIAQAAIERARTVAPKTELVRGMAEELPHADGSFDVVTCLGSLEHFIDPAKALEEMRRVTAPGGRAVIVVPNQWFAYDVARGWVEGAGLCHGQESERYFSIGEARDLIGASFAIFHEEGWSPPRGLADRTRPFTGRWRNAALRMYGWLRPRLPIQMSYVFVLAGRREPQDAPTLVWPFRDPVVPGGWHAAEESSRWTKETASVWLRLAQRVELNLLHDEPGGAPLPVRVHVDGRDLGTVTVAPHAWTDVTVDVPADLRGSVRRLTIAPARTWSPLDHGARGDVRTLGVSVRRIASV